MSLVNPLPWLVRAQRERFAIGAFNANTLEQVQAVVLAAQAEQAPAIVQVSHRAALHVGDGDATLGLRYMAAAGIVAAQSVGVPIALHLDHADEDEVREAIALGFTSVMFDAGEGPFELTTGRTAALREAAHARNVCIEAEVGEVPRADGSGLAVGPQQFTRPEDAARFVTATGVDSLAIALGFGARRPSEVDGHRPRPPAGDSGRCGPPPRAARVVRGHRRLRVPGDRAWPL